jgi:hypothetical protein
MRPRALGVVILAAAIGLTGCFPRKRVIWSPDGRWAAVLGGDGLRLCDATGKLSPPVPGVVSEAAWMPDSRRLLVQRQDGAATSWSDAKQYLAPQRREAVKRAAERVLANALLDYESWDEEALGAKSALFVHSLGMLQGLNGDETVALMFYLKDEAAGRVPDKLKRLWKLKEFGPAFAWLLQRAEVTQNGLSLGAVVSRSFDDHEALRLSPDGAVAAYLIHVQTREAEAAPRLCVLPLDGSGPPRTVANYVGKSADWSVDGRYLVFARTGQWPEKDQLVLGSISRCQVRDAGGKLLAEFGAIEDLAGVVFQPELRVRCLPDGRILFAAMDVQLPATAADMPPRGLMFAVNPGQNPVVMRLVPRASEEEVPDLVYAFEVSPDGQWASLPGGGGEVSVLNLRSGTIERIVEPFGLEGELLMVPTWRTANELCCLGPGAEGSGRAVVNLIRFNPGFGAPTQTVAPPSSKPGEAIEVIPLSTDWPESVARSLLFKTITAESQPAQGAAVTNPS